MSLDATPSEGAISIEQAASLLSSAPAETVEQEEQQDDASTIEAETVSEAEEPGDDGEAEEVEPAEPGVEAPAWWSAERKARFAELPPDLQAIVAEEEGKRETIVSKAKEEAAAERKRAETEFQTYTATMQALGQWLPNAIQSFQSQAQQFQQRWANTDWVALARDYPAEDFNQWKAQFEAEKSAVEQQQAYIQQAQATAQQATAQQRQRFLAEEGEKLARLRPELVDPKVGEARRKDLESYLLAQDLRPDQIQDLPAAAMNIAWKAQQYDKAQAGLAARPKPIPQRGNVQPSAAIPQRTSQQRSIEQIQSRLMKTGSIDDAVSLLQAQRKLG